MILIRGAINTYGSPLYGLSEFPSWADPHGNSTNCTDFSLLFNLTTTSLPSPSVTTVT